MLCLIGIAAAQEEEEEPAPPQLVDGLELRPTIALSAGYDSNPGELPDGEGAAFKRLDLGLRATLGEEGGTQAVLSLEGALVVFLRSDRDTQHEYQVELEVIHPISDELRLAFGASHRMEDLESPATTFSEAWGRAETEVDRVAFEIRGGIAEYREQVDRAAIVAADLEVYDYRTATAELRAALDIGAPVMPLVRARVAAIDYREQRPDKPDRDALEYSAMAGAALTLSDSLFVELGLRRTERRFDEPGAGSHARLGPEVEVAWEPGERLRLTAAYGHYFGEPTHEEMLVLDTTFAQLEAEYQASDRLTLTGGGSVLEEKEVGTGVRNTEWEVYADARWLIREHLRLLAAARYKQHQSGDPELEDVSRLIVRAGLESSF